MLTLAPTTLSLSFLLLARATSPSTSRPSRYYSLPSLSRHATHPPYPPPLSLAAQVDRFLANEAAGTKIIGAHSIEELCSKLKKPRKVMLLVKAGEVVDNFIGQIVSVACPPPRITPGHL